MVGIRQGVMFYMMISPTKYELNMLSGFSANAWKLLDKSEARK